MQICITDLMTPPSPVGGKSLSYSPSLHIFPPQRLEVYHIPFHIIQVTERRTLHSVTDIQTVLLYVAKEKLDADFNLQLRKDNITSSNRHIPTQETRGSNLTFYKGKLYDSSFLWFPTRPLLGIERVSLCKCDNYILHMHKEKQDEKQHKSLLLVTSV